MSINELRGMLKAQFIRAESDIRSAQLRRERILTRLQFLELEENMPKYEVTLKPGETLTVAAIREIVPTLEQMPVRCSQMFDTIERCLRLNRLSIGPAMTIYYNEGFADKNIDTECGFIIPNAEQASNVKSNGTVTIRQLEAVPLMASTIVVDDFYKKVGALLPAYTALAEWIEDNGYRIAGPPREIFYGSVKHGDLTAEVQFPVEKA